MAYQCIKWGGECDGCGSCQEEKPVLYAYNGTEIYPGDEYYDIDGEIVDDQGLYDWARKYLRKAGNAS